MATLAEIRAQYPQYSDMSDASLADALYKKFYSDMPRADFDTKLGVSAAAPAIGSSLADQIPGERRPGPAAKQEPNLWQTVRPYVAPTAEALGAVGGATLGTALGPAGTVGGAGLGYGMAKSLLKTADVAFGGEAPETATQALTRGAKDVLEGATMEAGGRVAGQTLGWLGGKIADMRQLPKQKAADLMRKSLATNSAARSDAQEVINALRAAPPGASVSEVTAGVKNPTWQALIRDSLAVDPAAVKLVNQMRDASDEQALNTLAKLASGSTAAETRGAAEVAKKNLNVITTPMRETALGRANLGKYVADEAAAREANDLAVMLGSGSAVDPTRLAAQATGAEKALRSVGVKPLEGAPLADKIAAIPINPKFAENDLIKGSADRVASAIRQWTASNGVIDANALEAIRKNAVDETIARLRPGFDATAQRNAAAGVMARIKPLIDDAIEGAGGEGWRDYLATHAKGMQQIAEKKLTGEAMRLWKTDKDAFVRLVQNESPETVEKFLGPGRYNIATELANSTMDALRPLAQKRLTQLAVDEQASEGTKALTKLVQQETSKLHVPSWFNFWASAGNKTLSQLETLINKKTMRLLTEAAQDPQRAANLLETLPGVERSRILNLIANPQSWKPGAGAAAVIAAPEVYNAGGELAREFVNELSLQPRQQNRNALSR